MVAQLQNGVEVVDHLVDHVDGIQVSVHILRHLLPGNEVGMLHSLALLTKICFLL